MKSILIVLDSLSSGGAEKSLVSMLNLLDYENYKVDLLLFNPKGLYLPLVPKQVNLIIPEYVSKAQIKYRSIINSLAIRFYRGYNKLSAPHKYHGAQTTWEYFGRYVYKALSKSYDVAIAYSQGQPTYFVASKVNAKKKICWINTDYNIAGYVPKKDKHYYDLFSKIVLVSDKGRDEFLKLFPKYNAKTTVVYDIISSKLILEMASTGKSFQDNYKGIRILTIGRLVYAKGYEFAIDAANILKDKGFSFRWYVIGEGDLEETLKQSVKEKGLQDNFHFLGTYVNPYPFIKDCDIYCQPSRFEGFGMAIAEAKILRKPIVATSFPIVYNQIEPNVNGLVCEMDGKSLAVGLLQLIENPELCSKIKDSLGKEILGSDEEIDKINRMIVE